VIDLLGVHRANDAEVISHGADLREQRADFLTRPTEALKLELRSLTAEFFALQLRNLLPLGERARHRLAMHGRQLGL
jgi:hypothetical protein